MAELKTGRYRHFKGKMYNVLGIARHSETLEELVYIGQSTMMRNGGTGLYG